MKGGTRSSSQSRDRITQHAPHVIPPPARGSLTVPSSRARNSQLRGSTDETEAFIEWNNLDCSAAQHLRELEPHLLAPVMETDVVNCRNPSAVVMKRIQDVKRSMSRARPVASESRRYAPTAVPPPPSQRPQRNTPVDEHHHARLIPPRSKNLQPIQPEFMKVHPWAVPLTRPTRSRPTDVHEHVEHHSLSSPPVTVPPPPLRENFSHRFDTIARSRSPRRGASSACETLSYDDVLGQVRTSAIHDWHAFCERAGGKYDPRFYPLAHLLAFLNGQQPPLVTLFERLSDFSKDELVALALMVSKRGAPPLHSHDQDLQKYCADELREYVEQHSFVFDE